MYAARSARGRDLIDAGRRRRRRRRLKRYIWVNPFFSGCCFHGCPSCFPHERTRTTDPTTRHSINELYYMTKKREMELKRRGYEYVCIWEHEFREQLEKDDKMREYVSTLDVTDRLNPRESFFGGRTNAIKLYHECKEPGETIEYYDFTR